MIESGVELLLSYTYNYDICGFDVGNCDGNWERYVRVENGGFFRKKESGCRII